MNDNKLADTQVIYARNHANSAVSYLDEVCRNCEAKEKCSREMTRCGISQARVRIGIASILLGKILDRRKEGAE